MQLVSWIGGNDLDAAEAKAGQPGAVAATLASAPFSELHLIYSYPETRVVNCLSWSLLHYGLPIAKRIAAILDKADAIRRKRQQAIKLADDFVRSVFLEMFGDPVTNPKGLEVKPVGEVADCIVPGRDKPKSFTGSIPWVTTNDLNHLDFTHCSKSNIGLSEEEIKNVRARVVPNNSVLMTCVGDIGVISISASDMVINQQLHAFLPSEEYVSTFLAYALSFQKSYMVSMASSTTLPYMNKKICNSVPVTVPPFQLQLQFENIFLHVAKLKNKLVNQDIIPLFNSLSNKAFSGKI